MTEAATRCPCCREELTPGRRVLLHLAAVPEPTHEHDPKMYACTAEAIHNAVGEPGSSLYRTLQVLEAEGLISIAPFHAQAVNGKNSVRVYLLTDEGKRVAASIQGGAR